MEIFRQNIEISNTFENRGSRALDLKQTDLVCRWIDALIDGLISARDFKFINYYQYLFDISTWIWIQLESTAFKDCYLLANANTRVLPKTIFCNSHTQTRNNETKTIFVNNPASCILDIKSRVQKTMYILLT